MPAEKPPHRDEGPNEPVPSGPWRPPRGPVSRGVAWVLLLLIALGLVAMLVMGLWW